MDIRITFDKEAPAAQSAALYRQYSFDARNGWNLIMLGEDAYEAQADNRLLYQLERVLETDLHLFDYWHPEVYNKKLNIQNIQQQLETLQTQILRQPLFYEHLQYGHATGNVENYLRTEILNDISFLIAQLELNSNNGASTLQYTTE